MRIGFNLSAVNPRFWIDTARAAEEAGFESLWLPEHLVLPVQMSGSPMTGHAEPPIPPDIPVWDIMVCFGMLAGVTDTIRFGTHVYNIGLRHPFVTARSVTTLEMLSGGRLEFGIGASWLEEEWDAAELDFATRGRRVDEAIEVCRRLWTEDTIEHHGEFFSFQPVKFQPKPVQEGGPPILVGGDSKAAKRRAATLGDGWIPMNHSLEQLPAGIAEVRQLRADAGIETPLQVTVGGNAATLDDIERHRDAGVDRILYAPFRSSREALDGIRRYGDEVLAKLDR